MTPRHQHRSCEMRAVWLSFLAFILIAPVARAQQHPATAPHRAYQRPMLARPIVRPIRPTIARPMLARPTIYRRAMPARRILGRYPRTSVEPYSFARPAVPAYDFRGAQPSGAWVGPRGYFNSFPFGGWPLNAYGYSQIPQNYQMLPLGFGMWPACDSAAIPGNFWTTGPCFGPGDYQSLAPNNQGLSAAESAPQYYLPPLDFIIQPEASPTSTKAQSAKPAQKQNMVVCLTNGKETEVSDQWVTQGKFFFVPISGAAKANIQTVDLNTLDLQKTIVENEKRGRTFILNFTPPDERPKLPVPSNQ